MKFTNRMLTGSAVLLLAITVFAQKAVAEGGEPGYKMCGTCSIMEEGCVGGKKCVDSFWVNWCTNPAECAQ